METAGIADPFKRKAMERRWATHGREVCGQREKATFMDES